MPATLSCQGVQKPYEATKTIFEMLELFKISKK